MKDQNLRLDELYHAEATNLIFKNKRRAYVQTCDGGRRKSFVAELLRDGLEFYGHFLPIFSILNYSSLGMFWYQDHQNRLKTVVTMNFFFTYRFPDTLTLPSSEQKIHENISHK